MIPKSVKLVSVDVETTGCDPKKESPVGRAKVWCMSIAWEEPTGVEARFTLNPQEFADCLSRPDIQTIGFNVHHFDYHALKNTGISLQNPVELLDLSRLYNSSTLYGHSLKRWAQRLNLPHTSFKTLASTLSFREGPHYKTTRVENKKQGWPIHYYPGTVWSVSWKKRRVHDLKFIWDSYPERRQAIEEYCLRDASYPLIIYKYLREELAR